MRLQFLQNFIHWLHDWKTSSEKGFSSETFLSVIQTSKAMLALVPHFINERSFPYVLIEKFQSDTME